MKSQRINLQGIPVSLHQIECKPGANTVVAKFRDSNAKFLVTADGAKLIEGQVSQDILTILSDHIALYFSPVRIKKPKNRYYAGN